MRTIDSRQQLDYNKYIMCTTDSRQQLDYNKYIMCTTESRQQLDYNILLWSDVMKCRDVGPRM